MFALSILSRRLKLSVPQKSAHGPKNGFWACDQQEILQNFSNALLVQEQLTVRQGPIVYLSILVPIYMYTVTSTIYLIQCYQMKFCNSNTRA